MLSAARWQPGSRRQASSPPARTGNKRADTARGMLDMATFREMRGPGGQKPPFRPPALFLSSSYANPGAGRTATGSAQQGQQRRLQPPALGMEVVACLAPVGAACLHLPPEPARMVGMDQVAQL